MIEAPTSPPRWIDQPATLQEMIKDLKCHPVLAVDTESNSLYVYREQVCLIQFSTGKVDYLVDPLAIKDLSSLNDIFADPGIEKVFHAAEYDLICLKRDYDFKFSSIFDTMIAARTLGRRKLSLAGLLEEEFGLQLDKRYQRANWGRRPLSMEMLAYARLDTFYLIPLRQRMVWALEKQDRLRLAKEDFSRLCQVTLPQPLNGHGNNLPPRMGGVKDLTKKQKAVLWELFHYRDQAAQSANLPPFKVFTNQMLISLALACPQNEEELAFVKGISPRQARPHGRGLIRAVRRGLDGEPPIKNNNRRMPDERFMLRLEALRNWRKQTGQRMGVQSDVIMPREVMETIAEANPTRLGELKQTMQTIPWRFEHFGDEILEILKEQKTR